MTTPASSPPGVWWPDPRVVDTPLCVWQPEGMTLHPTLSFAVLAVVGLFGGCAAADVSCDDVDCDDGDYCLLLGTDVPTESASVSCVALPDECAAAPDCDCLLASHDGFGSCEEGGDDGFEFTVPGG